MINTQKSIYSRKGNTKGSNERNFNKNKEIKRQTELKWKRGNLEKD